MSDDRDSTPAPVRLAVARVVTVAMLRRPGKPNPLVTVVPSAFTPSPGSGTISAEDVDFAAGETTGAAPDTALPCAVPSSLTPAWREYSGDVWSGGSGVLLSALIVSGKATLGTETGTLGGRNRPSRFAMPAMSLPGYSAAANADDVPKLLPVAWARRLVTSVPPPVRKGTTLGSAKVTRMAAASADAWNTEVARPGAPVSTRDVSARTRLAETATVLRTTLVT
jgi:hypothetical protein